MRRPRLPIWLALLLLVPMASFASGGPEATTSTGTKVNPRGVFPVVNEKITLSVFYRQDPLITDYEDNYQTQWLEEKTNIRVNWMLAPSQQIAEKMNLLLASGTDLPDVFMQGTTNTTLLKYGQEGLFRPLNDYVKTYGDEINKIIADLKPRGVDLLAAYTTPDGKIYGLPSVNTCRWCETTFRNWVDVKWMDKLGLKIPNTVDEFVAMLKAFKTKDPNGNGKADEIPLMGARTGWGAQVEGYLMMPFIVYNGAGTDRLVLDKATGKVTAAYTQPAYLEGIKFIRGLVVDGLLDPVSLTQTAPEYQVMGEAEPTIVGDHLGSNFPWLTLKDEKYRNMEAIPPLVGVVSGKKQTFANGYMPLGNAVFLISKSCKYPEAAFRWADFQYSYDNSMLSRYAKKGVDWVPADPGTKGPFGDPAVFREVGQWGAPTKNSNRQMFMYLSYKLLDGLQMTDARGVAVNSDAHYVLRTSKYMDVGISNAVPRVFILPQEVDAYGELSATLSTYVAESFARFVAGSLPLSDWDKFQAELKTIGVERFVQMTEAAYKRQYMK